MSEQISQIGADTSCVITNKPLLACTGFFALLVAFVAFRDDRLPPQFAGSVLSPDETAAPPKSAFHVELAHSESSQEGDRSPLLRNVTEEREGVRDGMLVRTGSRELRVVVRDREEQPIPRLKLAVEALEDSGVWSLARVHETGEQGEARFSGLWEESSYRVRASFPSAPASVDVLHSDVVHLSLDRPILSGVELQSTNGIGLSGARRVEFHAQGPGATRAFALSPTSKLAHWSVPLAQPVKGVLHVTDSLGRLWSTTVELAPGEITQASPDSNWIAIARADLPGTRVAPPVERARLRWSLRIGERSTRRGSGWLAPHGGFHAVLSRDEARRSGGRLELRWNSSEGEREHLCWWYPDPTLEHIALLSSPLGEVPSLSSEND